MLLFGGLMTIQEFFKLHKNIVVSFSGGVDSAVLLHMAKRYAENTFAVFVKSQFQPEFQLKDAKKFCDFIGIDLKVINVDMLQNNKITENSENRCYYCKKSIFENISSVYRNYDEFVIIDGTNADDDISDRPGYKALQELGVISPLKICGVNKKEIRQYAKDNDLFLWNKPSYSCLATRIPNGEIITEKTLYKIEHTENTLREMGFTDFKANCSNGNAILQLSSKDFDKLIETKNKVYQALKIHFNQVYLDLKER